VAWLPSGARPARAFGLGSQKAVTEWVGSFDRDNVSRPTVTYYPSSTGSRARRDWTRAAFQIGLFRGLIAFQFRFDRCATRCRHHDVKPSTTFLIRNYFVADCVAYRSREPAETDSMDSSARPGTREPLPAEIRALRATLKSLTPTDFPYDCVVSTHCRPTDHEVTGRIGLAPPIRRSASAGQVQCWSA
jgi:hypothetical protein